MAKRTRKRKRKTRRKKVKSKKRYNKRTRKIKVINCAPKKKKVLSFTCYTPKNLLKLKKLWNMKHPGMKIKSNKPYDIWTNLRDSMENVCGRESCWLNQQFVKENVSSKMFKDTFRPYSPKKWKRKPDEWLTSIDIINVMKQYETFDKRFEFIGPSPIDYDTHTYGGECVWEELCKFNLSDNIKKKKTKVGVIFNLDKHDQPGSHWVAVFLDIKKNKIYYFDSYGDKTPGRIMQFIKDIQSQGLELRRKIKFSENKTRHQYSNSECGMYCIHFIIRMMKGDSFEKHQRKKISDSKMKRLRKIYFNQK